jgi:hypothetical protein
MKLIVASLLGIIMLCPLGSSAALYSFSCGTNTIAADCATSEAYLSLEVLDTELGASFKFTNVGPLLTHTKDIWIDDDSGILNIGSAVKTQSAGVNYTNLAVSSQNVGGLPSFVAEAETNVANAGGGGAASGLTSGSTASASPEYLMFDIALNVLDGVETTFADLIAALNSGTLRAGIHVGSYASGGSEKFSTVSAVPVPTAAWLFGTALIGFIGMARRTKV